VTGLSGGWLVPESVLVGYRYTRPACTAEANGFAPLAGSGTVRLSPEAHWKQSNALQNVVYTCHGDAVAVTYPFGKGTVVWWASSLPLENDGIQQADNLVFFLNSIGSRERHVYWDESLHGDAPGLMSYTQGTPLSLALWQGGLVALLLLWSFARRSGPLRPDPVVRRSTPIEFVHSLGALYQASNASQTAVSDAYQQFRQMMERQAGIPHTLPAEDPFMPVLLRRHFGPDAEQMQQALVAAEQAGKETRLAPRTALARIQALHDCFAVIDYPIHPSLMGTLTWTKAPSH
jgi:hypothetical protein